jgi:hypothetical protein
MLLRLTDSVKQCSYQSRRLVQGVSHVVDVGATVSGVALVEPVAGFLIIFYAKTVEPS